MIYGVPFVSKLKFEEVIQKLTDIHFEIDVYIAIDLIIYKYLEN